MANVIWIARHDNGWQTHVEERPDGTFAAWAIPEGAVVSGPDYIEMDVENAQRAGEYALRTKRGVEWRADGTAVDRRNETSAAAKRAISIGQRRRWAKSP